MIKRKYLTEVAFKNGIDEFRAYISDKKETNVITTEPITSYKIQLDHEDIDEESIFVEIENKYDIVLKWRKVNGEDSSIIEVYTEGTDALLNGDKIVLNYIALNNYSSDLYSVDYDTGTLYLAHKSNISLKCTCEFYTMLLTGRAAEQLHEDSYSISTGLITLNNIVETYTYSSLYNREVKSDIEYTTPFIHNIKVNYINTIEQESL